MLRHGSLFLLGLLITWPLYSQDRGGELPDGVQLVAPGVWFIPGDVVQGTANTTVIAMRDYLIVVDPGFPGRSREILAMLPEISPKPVQYVFDTHAHGDHAYGNAVWTAAGAQTMAFSGVKADMDRWEPRRWQAAAAVRADVKATGDPDVERPKKLLQGERFTLEDGSRRVDFLNFGWGHTQGDGYVWLPKERILVSGDAAVNGPYSYLNDAWIEHWPRVLEAAIQLRPEVVLPGHGAAGGPEILVGERRFLTDLYRLVGEEIAFGRTPAQMHFRMPEWDKPWVPANLSTDIDLTFAEERWHVPAGMLEADKK